MSHTHDLSEWAAFLSLGVGVHAALSMPYFLFVDANLADFDPHPLLARAVDRLLVEVVRAKGGVRDELAKALLVLALRFNAPVSAPKGATR